MPDTYWPTDDKLEIASTKYQKKDFGLPQRAFVFGSFNQPYKIEQQVYESWLNILTSFLQLNNLKNQKWHMMSK